MIKAGRSLLRERLLGFAFLSNWLAPSFCNELVLKPAFAFKIERVANIRDLQMAGYRLPNVALPPPWGRVPSGCVPAAWRGSAASPSIFRLVTRPAAASDRRARRQEKERCGSNRRKRGFQGSVPLKAVCCAAARSPPPGFRGQQQPRPPWRSLAGGPPGGPGLAAGSPAGGAALRRRGSRQVGGRWGQRGGGRRSSAAQSSAPDRTGRPLDDSPFGADSSALAGQE